MEEGNYRVDRFTLNPISSGDFGKGDQLGRQKMQQYFWVGESDN